MSHAFHRITCPSFAHADALASYLTSEDAFASVISDGDKPVVIAQCHPELVTLAAHFCSF